MPTLYACPGPCEAGQRRHGQYLCPTCWSGLPDTARRRLNQRTGRALARLRELQAQLAAAVPLHEIKVNP